MNTDFFYLFFNSYFKICLIKLIFNTLIIHLTYLKRWEEDSILYTDNYIENVRILQSLLNLQLKRYLPWSFLDSEYPFPPLGGASIRRSTMTNCYVIYNHIYTQRYIRSGSWWCTSYNWFNIVSMCTLLHKRRWNASSVIVLNEKEITHLKDVLSNFRSLIIYMRW